MLNVMYDTIDCYKSEKVVILNFSYPLILLNDSAEMLGSWLEAK
jgi:hypothetical protein